MARRPRVDVSRALFLAVLAATSLGVAYYLGLRAGVERTAAYFFWTDLTRSIGGSVGLVAAEAPTLTGVRPTHFLQASRYEGDGVTVNDPSRDQSDLILISGFFDGNNGLRMMRRNGDVVARWTASHRALMGRRSFMPSAEVPASDWNIDLHGALALPDGSVVFNFEYGGTVKLDRCGAVEWTVDRRTHHSVERAESGGFWIPSRRGASPDGPSPYPPFTTPFAEDTVLHVSHAGEILSEFSVVRLLYDNGLEPLLTVNSGFTPDRTGPTRELVHLNKVDELPTALAADFPMFTAGDLVLSIRQMNMLLVVDPEGRRVKWWKVGPWRRQHDPGFMPGGRLVLFNNNLYASALAGPDRKTPLTAPRVSEILAVDPSTGLVDTLYGGTPGEALLSATRGKVDVTVAGGLLVTEADGGRVFETDADRRVVWEYVARYDDGSVAEVGEARVYPEQYFTFDTADWSCPAER